MSKDREFCLSNNDFAPKVLTFSIKITYGKIQSDKT